MKTLIFPSEFVDNKGGVPQSIVSLVTGLAKFDDFNIVVLCPNESEMSTIKFPNNVNVITTKSRKWVISKNSLLGTLRTIIDLYISIKNMIGNDTWVITNQPVTSSLFSLFPCRHIREFYINRGGDFNDNGVASYIMRKKIKNNLVDYAVGISKKQVDLLINCGMPKDKVFVVHNGLPMPSVSYSNVILKKEQLRITTIGFISDLKNQIEGVKLIYLLRNNNINAILNIYGDFDSDERYKKLMLDTVHDLKLDAFINYYGFVSGEKLFENTDILISFSKTEGFGRTLVEGMLRHKPIIAWKGAGGPVDITENGKYGHLVENNEASDYYKVITEILDNPSCNNENVEKSYRYACQHFTVECMVDKYVKLFRTVCK